MALISKPTPFFESQNEVGASFGDVDGWSVPFVYSNESEEYSAALERVILYDQSPTGRVWISGSDGPDLLNRLSTNLVDPISVGSVVSTVLTNNKGRIIDAIKIVKLDEGLLILTSPQRREAVVDWINKYTIVEDIEVVDFTESSAMLTLIGPSSEISLLNLLQLSSLDFKSCQTIEVSWRGKNIIIIQSASFSIPAFDIIVPSDKAKRLWEDIMTSSGDVGLTLAGEKTIEILRIQNRIPKWGSELSPEYNPIEAGLTASISWSKGCYIGQEVIARLWTYQKIQKYLVGIAFDSSLAPLVGSDLRIKEKKVGILTSASFHPTEGKYWGLGYLKSSEARIGSVVDVATDSDSIASGEIIAIPEIPSHQTPQLL